MIVRVRVDFVSLDLPLSTLYDRLRPGIVVQSAEVCRASRRDGSTTRPVNGWIDEQCGRAYGGCFVSYDAPVIRG